MVAPRRAFAALLVSLPLFSCGRSEQSGTVQAAMASPCAAPARLAALPKDLVEASGMAVSRAHEGVIWVINDGDPHLYAIDRSGQQLGKVRVPVKVGDWEDLALAPCATGDCIYIGDIGDNQHERDDVAILRIPEPAPSDPQTAQPERFAFRYPDGPRDAEALIVLPGERLHIVTKGRHGPVALYRFPPLAPGGVLALEQVRAFTPGVVQMPDMVTGASATPSGKWVAIRAYAWVDLYPADEQGLAAERKARMPLESLRERQGEGVAITDDGELLFVSERGGGDAPLSAMRCTLE